MSGFDPFGDFSKYVGIIVKSHRATKKVLSAGQRWREQKQAEEQQARHREEQEEVLRNPPPIHGSAAWATVAELQNILKGRDAFDNPSSILLGAFDAGQEAAQFVHWDGDGHLLTVAPTRSGKAYTVIVPNLLRYKGSAVVIDPKSEIYEKTSAWRAANVGPVYRLAPFDDASDPKSKSFIRHRFNPLTRVRSQADARALAELMFPRDANSPEFFTDDAVAFLTALIQFVIDEAPEGRATLAAVVQAASLPHKEFLALVRRMSMSRLASVATAGQNVLGKSTDRGLPGLRDTLHSKLALWTDDEVRDTLRQHDFDFESLKDNPATVYIDVPFDLIKPYSPWLRVILKSALDAMLRNRRQPNIPVLFVLDEFLQLGPFPEFRDAIRTHAGAGVRLWFFLQDVSTLEEHYPNAWRPFLNTSVKQFFGVDDPFTAELVGKYLGNTTVAYRTTTASSNVSGKNVQIFDDDPSITYSSSDSVQLHGRPLLTPDEIIALLSSWKGDGWRNGIVHTRGPRPFQVRLVSFEKSKTCMQRIGFLRG